MIDLRRFASSPDAVFIAIVVSYAAVFLAFYPVTWSIDDESNILALATALSRGTVFLDAADIDLGVDFAWRGHLISKFSPFHAALFVPAILSSFRLAFLWGFLSVLAGAFIVRSMLLERGLSSGWVVLYFLCPGLLYYSRTLLAAVPAAVAGLCGAWLLFRRVPRPMVAALLLGVSVLFHPWMAPFSAVLVAGWWLERNRGRLAALIPLFLGVAPAVVLAAWYDSVTTGSPLLNTYLLIGAQTNFGFRNAPGFAAFYFSSLLLSPLAGWAVFRPKWAGSRTVVVAAACVLTAAALYYYRDGREYGLTGWIPGQRFLIPGSLLAVVPAAAFLDNLVSRSTVSRKPVLAGLAIIATAGFMTLSYLHQEYLLAHKRLQDFVATSIPQESTVLASERFSKEFAPVRGHWRVVVARSANAFDPSRVDPASYLAWIGPPESTPPESSMKQRRWRRTSVRTWIFNRDAWIGVPAVARTGADVR